MPECYRGSFTHQLEWKGDESTTDVAPRPGPAAAEIRPRAARCRASRRTPSLPSRPADERGCAPIPRPGPAAACLPLSRGALRWRAAPPCGLGEALRAERRREGSGAASAVAERPSEVDRSESSAASRGERRALQSRTDCRPCCRGKPSHHHLLALLAVNVTGVLPHARITREKLLGLCQVKFYFFASPRSDHGQKRTVCPALIAHLGQVALHFHSVSLHRMIKKKEVWQFSLGDPEGEITRELRSCKHALGAFKGRFSEKEQTKVSTEFCKLSGLLAALILSPFLPCLPSQWWLKACIRPPCRFRNVQPHFCRLDAAPTEAPHLWGLSHSVLQLLGFLWVVSQLRC